ncbi:hypothetical protein BaRGS_00033537 [Batillaria attramentaria]|uniref:Copper type II ascorbate-dependent monooxygenase C-terminal domain-containing protein n=1 Tax=Batillaria attramentaria TaxID=370345 RepID=A0ABD0JKD6_9CAEN
MALQLHWNNPELVNTYQDSSGITLHYTSNLRQHDVAVWVIGNTHFDIHPRQSHVTVEAKCSSTCTKTHLKEPVYVTVALNHMHHLGVSQTIEHYRNGTWLRYITNDVIFSYDSPQVYEYVTPIEALVVAAVLQALVVAAVLQALVVAAVLQALVVAAVLQALVAAAVLQALVAA